MSPEQVADLALKAGRYRRELDRAGALLWRVLTLRQFGEEPLTEPWSAVDSDIEAWLRGPVGQDVVARMHAAATAGLTVAEALAAHVAEPT